MRSALLAALLSTCLACSGLAQPSELYSCLEPGSYCSETEIDTLYTPDSGCGQTFYQWTGRLAWPALMNRGPITISVLTRATGNTEYPLYFETIGPFRPDWNCTTLMAGYLVMEAEGFPMQCGGVWETIGPLDLTQNGVPLGAVYHIQAMSLLDHWSSQRSTGLACIRVTSAAQSTAVANFTWGGVKGMYK